MYLRALWTRDSLMGLHEEILDVLGDDDVIIFFLDVVCHVHK